MEVWAVLSLTCFKAEESKMYLGGQRQAGRSQFPWVVLWAQSDLQEFKSPHLDLHDGRWLRTELVSACCTAVWKLEASGPAIYLSLGSLNASHVRTHLFHGWQCCVKVVSRISLLHLHKWGLLFCKYLHMCRTAISEGLIEGVKFSGVRSQHLRPKLSLLLSHLWIAVLLTERWDEMSVTATLICSALHAPRQFATQLDA